MDLFCGLRSAGEVFGGPRSGESERLAGFSDPGRLRRLAGFGRLAGLERL